MSLYRRGQVWWYDLQVHGQPRTRGSTGTADKRLAQRLHDEKKAELWRTRPQVGPHERTWHDACVAWLEAAPRDASDRYTLRALDYPDRPLTHCTAESFERALDGNPPATWNRKRAILQAILHQAGIHLDIATRKVPRARIRYLTAEEWQRLDAALPSHLQPLARFAIATGLRQTNVTDLRWEQIDLKRRVAWIHPDQAKAGQAIGIPLSDLAMQVLTRQREIVAQRSGDARDHPYDAGWVFPYHRDGRPIGKIKTAWTKALKRARITDFRWHDLRHTWASWHVMSGTPLEVLKALGGWKDYSMVLRYAHLAPDHLAGYADNARPYRSVA